MKKISICIFTLILCLNLTAYSKEKLTLEEKINKKCGVKIQNYLNNKTIDNEIDALECVYNMSKWKNVDTSLYTNQLSILYTTKYSQSAENQEYFKKMYKYSVAAMDDGVMDKDLFLLIISCACLNDDYNVITQNSDIKNIDKAFELLYQLSPDEAEKIKPQVIAYKEKKNNQIANIVNTSIKATEKSIKEQADNRSVWDPNLNTFITKRERREMIQSGQYQSIIQTNQLKELNQNLQNIDSSLNSINSKLYY